MRLPSEGLGVSLGPLPPGQGVREATFGEGTAKWELGQLPQSHSANLIANVISLGTGELEMDDPLSSSNSGGSNTSSQQHPRSAGRPAAPSSMRHKAADDATRKGMRSALYRVGASMLGWRMPRWRSSVRRPQRLASRVSPG